MQCETRECVSGGPAWPFSSLPSPLPSLAAFACLLETTCLWLVGWFTARQTLDICCELGIDPVNVVAQIF